MAWSGHLTVFSAAVFGYVPFKQFAGFKRMFSRPFCGQAQLFVWVLETTPILRASRLACGLSPCQHDTLANQIVLELSKDSDHSV